MNYIFLLTALFLLSSEVHSESEVNVLYSPESIVFQNTNKPMLSSDYSKFIALCLGYSTEKPSNWDGFYGYKNFANIPQSVVTFHSSASLEPLASKRFSIEQDSDLEKEYKKISQMMITRSVDTYTEKVELVNKNKNDHDIEEQLNKLNSYLDQLENLRTNESLPNKIFLWFNVNLAANDNKAIEKFQSEMKNVVLRLRKLLNDDVIFLAIKDPSMSSVERNVRETKSVKEDTVVKKNNLAYVYSVDFHTAFVTIGFSTIVFVLAVFAISVAMWNIDPGRDSIIYRLTSQKIKKDQ